MCRGAVTVTVIAAVTARSGVDYLAVVAVIVVDATAPPSRPFPRRSSDCRPPEFVCLHLDVIETCRRQPLRQRRRLNGVVGVVLVVCLEFLAAKAVAGHQRRAGLQHACYLSEQLVLQF